MVQQTKNRYLNKGEYFKQRDQIKRRKSIEPKRNKEKKDCPYLTEKLEGKSSKMKKSLKSFKKHSTIDNRRMTGNVNIYICSEASNEKEKQESRESDSVMATETDIKASLSTISSNKLITDLLERRKQLQKSSLQRLSRKSETVLKSRIEEIPREENHVNDAATDTYVAPSLDPVSNYEAVIINTSHKNDMKTLEKNNKNFNHFNNNDGDHSCTLRNCPYLKGRSIGHRSYIKNNYPMNVKRCTKNKSIIPNSTIDSNCLYRKTICPYVFKNGSVMSVKRFEACNANSNERKERFDGKWQELEIEDVCIYCTSRRNKKLEQCSAKKLNTILKNCIKSTKQRETIFKNFGTSQRRNCAEQCSISNSILKEEMEENNINLNEEDLPEENDSQRKEVYVSSSHKNGKETSIDELNIKYKETMLPAKSEIEKSSLLLSSINYEEKYPDKSSRKIESLSEDKDQSRLKYISKTEFVSPVTASSIVSDKVLDTANTEILELDTRTKKVTSSLKGIEESVIIEKDKLTLSIASVPFSKNDVMTETEENERELDDKIEKNLKSKENQKDSFLQRVVNRVKRLVGYSSVIDNVNDKRRRGCGSSCRAHPRNFLKDGDAEDHFLNEDVKEYHQPVVSSLMDKSNKEEMATTQETILTSQSSKNVIINQDKIENYEHKVESPKDVFNINKVNASKVRLRRLIAKKKMLQDSNRNEYTTESKEIKIAKDNLEIQEDTQDATSATKEKESKSFKDTVGSITNRTEDSKSIKEFNSEKSKNFESLRSLQFYDKIHAKDSQIIEDTQGSVINSKEIETPKNFTNSPRTIISKNSKNLESSKVSPSFKITNESHSLRVLEDPEKSVFSKNKDHSISHVKSTENSESDSTEADGVYHPYIECLKNCIESKEAPKIDPVCNCKESENDFRVCIVCCCPEDNCNCNNRNNMKTMICVNPINSTYYDNPHESCICQKPVCNSSHYNITENNCNCDKKNIVSVQNNDNMICVTSWKASRVIEKYVPRTLRDFKKNPKDCRCFVNSKPYGSDELPYQRLGAFSKVMTELQEKINESVTCKNCKHTPCYCVMNETKTITKEATENTTKSYTRSPSRSPSSCKCLLNTCDSLSWKTSSSKVTDGYKPTSCYCRQNKSTQCPSHRMRCHCKFTPCRCKRSRETSKSRSCR